VQSGSKFEIWFGATMAGPVRGIFSTPSIFHRNSSRNTETRMLRTMTYMGSTNDLPVRR